MISQATLYAAGRRWHTPEEDTQVTKHKLFIRNIAFSATTKDLEEHFARYTPREAVVVEDRETGNSRGFGFVVFEDEDEMHRCRIETDGSVLHGRPLIVAVAK